MLKIIAAVAKNRVIGKDGALPWHLPDDLAWFKKCTGIQPVAMGRKTYESLPPRFKPLPGRLNIVLTRELLCSENPTLTFVDEFDRIIERAKDEDVWVIGGRDIYAMALPHADELYLTRVHEEVDGDVFFPEWHVTDWLKVFEEKHSADEKHDHDFTFEIYVRRQEAEQPTHPFIEMANVRTGEQRAVMETILEANHCPFCLENLRLYHKPEIIREGEHWLLTYNQWRYTNTKCHLLLISKAHAVNLSELPLGAGEECFELLRWAEQRFEIESGALGMRFGNPLINGATVRHLHAQIIAPHPKAKGPALFYVGKTVPSSR